MGLPPYPDFDNRMLEPSHQEILIPPPIPPSPFYLFRFFRSFFLFAGVWKGPPGFHAAFQRGVSEERKGERGV